MKNLKLFEYWINERHKIYLMKSQGMAPPWTEDPILRDYKFTNVFRELDKVTIALNRMHPKKQYGQPMHMYEQIFRVIAFRLFNWPQTYEHLCYSMANGQRTARYKWSDFAVRLHRRKAKGEKIFTGAYIVTNNGSKENKIDLYCKALDVIWKQRHKICSDIDKCNTLQEAHKVIKRLPMCGNFVAYEIVTDLRHRNLSHATDIMTWANAGPGAIRGLNRLNGDDIKKRIKQEDANVRMNHYMQLLNQDRAWWVPELEMRDIEHSLCEFDKYMRVKNNEGRPRSRYDSTRYQHSE